MPVPETAKYEGGIQDFGSYAEGYCAKVKTDDKARSYDWIICMEKNEDKMAFMETLKKIVILNQRKNGIVLVPNQPPKKPDMSEFTKPREPGPTLGGTSDGSLGVTFNSKTNNIKDGYWIVLQDWSQCNLKCGGGNSTLQRMCVPPKTGGKPCEGEAVLKRKCNTKPCPQIISNEPTEQNSTKIDRKPIVKVLPFSTRPQRYSVFL